MKNQSSIRNILVLEDFEGRIDWLANNVPFNVNIHWHTQVNEFIDVYKEFIWDLIIFDCDLSPEETFDFNDSLGLYLPNESDWCKMLDRDSNGYNGVDAARFLAQLPDVDKTIPCLIWSANPSGTQDIKHILTNHGFKSVINSKYDKYFLPKLKNQIYDLLGYQ